MYFVSTFPDIFEELIELQLQLKQLPLSLRLGYLAVFAAGLVVFGFVGAWAFHLTLPGGWTPNPGEPRATQGSGSGAQSGLGGDSAPASSDVRRLPQPGVPRPASTATPSGAVTMSPSNGILVPVPVGPSAGASSSAPPQGQLPVDPPPLDQPVDPPVTVPPLDLPTTEPANPGPVDGGDGGLIGGVVGGITDPLSP